MPSDTTVLAPLGSQACRFVPHYVLLFSTYLSGVDAKYSDRRVRDRGERPSSKACSREEFHVCNVPKGLVEPAKLFKHGPPKDRSVRHEPKEQDTKQRAQRPW